MFGLTRRLSCDRTTRRTKRNAAYKIILAFPLAPLGLVALAYGLFHPHPAAAMEMEGGRFFLKTKTVAERPPPPTRTNPRQPGWGVTAKRSIMAMVNGGTNDLPQAPRLTRAEAEEQSAPIMGRLTGGSGSGEFKNVLRSALKKGGKHAGRGALAIAGKAAGKVPSLRWLGKKHRVFGITIDPILPQMRINNDGTLEAAEEIPRKKAEKTDSDDEKKKKKRFWNADLHWSPLKPTRFALDLEPTDNIDLRPRINLNEQTLDLSFSHRTWGLTGEVAADDGGVESLGARYQLTQHTDVGVGLHGLAAEDEPQSRIEIRFSKPF